MHLTFLSKQMHKDQTDLRSKMLDTEFQSMRENFIFYGLSETTGPTESATRNSDTSKKSPLIDMEAETQMCTSLVKEFITTELGIGIINMLFDCARRLGNHVKFNRPRPIVVKFHYFHKRELVQEASNQKRADVKAANLGVSVQISKKNGAILIRNYQQCTEKKSKKEIKLNLLGNICTLTEKSTTQKIDRMYVPSSSNLSNKIIPDVLYRIHIR